MFGFDSKKPANPVKLFQDVSGAPAIDLAKIRDNGHLELAKAADKAGLALSKRGIAGIRAQAVLILDHSGSMRADFQSGAVQKLVERILGFALQIDVDGTVPVIVFDSVVRQPVNVTIDNYKDIVNKVLWRPQDMGTTNLADALEALRDMAKITDTPIYAAAVTDGEPDNAARATKVACDLARYPAFLKFAALRPVAYLNTLNKLSNEHRLLDNCNSQPADRSLNLLSCTDLEFQDAMAEEWDTWVPAATQAGVLL